VSGPEGRVPPDVKRSIWLRDEFSCRICGRTIGWEELNIGVLSSKEGEESMIALCGSCVKGDDRPIEDPTISRLMAVIQQLECAGAEFEPSQEKGPQELKDAIVGLEGENKALREELDRRLGKLVAYKQRCERAEKDYQNLKARNEKEVAAKVWMGLKGVLVGTISSIDDLDRAIMNLSGPDRSGIEAVRKLMARTLDENGVRAIDPKGERFDPTVHEAVEIVERGDLDEATVVEVLGQGYLLDGKVLRPARVIVSRHPAPVNGDLVEFEIAEDEEEYTVVAARKKRPPPVSGPSRAERGRKRSRR